MANVVVVLNPSGRVVAVEKRDATLLRSGKVLFDSLGDARAFTRGDLRTDRSLAKRSLELSERKKFADEIRASPDFTDEQKEEWYTLLSGRVFALDYFTTEVRADGPAPPPAPGPAHGGEAVLAANFWDP